MSDPCPRKMKYNGLTYAQIVAKQKAVDLKLKKNAKQTRVVYQ